MKKDGKQMAKLVGGLLLTAVVILIVFFLLNQRPDEEIYAKEGTINTEAQALLDRDLDRNYPANVREVVRLYARISKCWYNETITRTELSGLIAMQRMLFDEEFLTNNPLSTQEAKLTNEIETAKEEKTTMWSYRVQKESSVEKWESEGVNYASIVACFLMRRGKNNEYSYEEFLLREDENERWKIVGWRLTEPIEIVD